MDDSEWKGREKIELEEYLERRSRLSNEASEFRCPDSCPRYGCKDPELRVPVTLMDLLLQSWTIKSKPSDIYQRSYKTGWSPRNETPWVGLLTVELKKPCGFLREEWCEVYPARPIGCAQFPEAWFLWPSENPPSLNRDRLPNYPCLKRSPPISRTRKKHLATLSEMAAQEQWLSDFFLFGFSPFYLDLRNLVEGLVQMGKHRSLVSDRIDPAVPHVIPYRLVEELLQVKLDRAGITGQILKKVASLDRVEGRASFFESKAVTDEMRKSRSCNDVFLFHRLEEDTLQSHLVARGEVCSREKVKVSIEGKDNGRQRKAKRAQVQRSSSGLLLQKSRQE
ncbi:MAG: hypothetical protein GTN74_17890 [Proteobacteria bacterium]|nr:hypothetical protein [Pseudomonadota bacterium]NIS72779.1 hypothetical protein [Pseudomonadota bacterium]